MLARHYNVWGCLLRTCYDLGHNQTPLHNQLVSLRLMLRTYQVGYDRRNPAELCMAEGIL